jgi:hypothetical protein
MMSSGRGFLAPHPESITCHREVKGKKQKGRKASDEKGGEELDLPTLEAEDFTAIVGLAAK